MKFPASFSALIASIFTSNTYALQNWNWVGSLSVGPAWENAGETQTFFLTPEIEKTFTANNRTRVLADSELFIGVQQQLTKPFHAQLGLAIVHTGNANLSGDIWDDADPTFNNYSYEYQIQHTHIAAKGKFLYDGGYPVIPWISVSLGVGFNRSHDFHNDPVIEEAVLMSNFKSYTETTFTYVVGIGFQRTFEEHWQVGVGYEFADWGSSHLGRAEGQTLNDGLSLNHLYTNALMFNITYLQGHSS